MRKREEEREQQRTNSKQLDIIIELRVHFVQKLLQKCRLLFRLIFHKVVCWLSVQCISQTVTHTYVQNAIV